MEPFPHVSDPSTVTTVAARVREALKVDLDAIAKDILKRYEATAIETRRTFQTFSTKNIPADCVSEVLKRIRAQGLLADHVFDQRDGNYISIDLPK